MEIDNKKIISALLYLIKNNDDINRYELTRLYEDFSSYKSKSNYELTITDITIVANNIFNYVENNVDKIRKNKELILKVLIELRLLNHYIHNIDINDKKKVNNILLSITTIESLLKLDISYPHILRQCLIKKVDSVCMESKNNSFMYKDIENDKAKLEFHYYNTKKESNNYGK